LSRVDQEKVRMGNIMMRFTVSVLAACRHHVVPAAVENPAGSRIWLCPPMAQALRWREARQIVVDYCQYGEPFRKRTRVLSIFVDLETAARRCAGKGICTATGKPHEQLRGCRNGVFRTALAEPYPPAWCSELARCFQDALAARFCQGCGTPWQ